MEGVRQVTDLRVFRLFAGLAVLVEISTRHYAPDFRWLRVQGLRSSESVCANLTEGFYSQYSTEYLQSLYRCRREARETMTHIEYGSNVRQLKQTEADKLLAGYAEALILLGSLISSIECKIKERGKGKDFPSVVKESAEEYISITNPFTDELG